LLRPSPAADGQEDSEGACHELEGREEAIVMWQLIDAILTFFGFAGDVRWLWREKRRKKR
jgi:hypothetical protein